MTLADFLTKLRRAFGQEEPADYDRSNAEHRREAREETTLNILRADWQEESRYRKSVLRWTRAAFVVSFATLVAVGYYAHVSRQQRDEMSRAADATEKAAVAAIAANKTTERQLELAERARVLPDVADPHLAEWFTTVTFRNIGRGAAFDIGFSVRQEIAKSSATPSRPSLTDGSFESIDVIAGNDSERPHRPHNFPLLPLTRRIVTGEDMLFFWVTVEYRDQLSGEKLRHTQYCWRYQTLKTFGALLPCAKQYQTIE